MTRAASTYRANGRTPGAPAFTTGHLPSVARAIRQAARRRAHGRWDGMAESRDAKAQRTLTLADITHG